MSEECAVKIAVRERPLLPEEAALDAEKIINHGELHENIIVVEDRPFVFDKVLGPNVQQEELFDTTIKPLVGKMLQGFCCTVLAYGQTGTGKSFTMGLHNQDLQGESAGIIPRVLSHIFDLKNQENDELRPNVSLSVSFVEIYNEKVYDLLTDTNADHINIKGCKFIGGTKKQVTNLFDAILVLDEGNKNRHVRPTKMNANSSRSHAIFTIHSIIKKTDMHMVSSMNLVDLAGTEGIRRTGHQGVALTEGVNINQGLLSIGKVLQALSSGSKVIPYRDSVLSLVLQDSLNLNSFLTLVACISPLKDDVSETLSTLRFAQNSKSLRHTPQINAILAEFKAKTPKKSIMNAPLRTKNNLPAVTPTPKKQIFTTSTVAKRKSPSAFLSNTFCTPSKIRRTDKKHNRSDFGITPIKPLPPKSLSKPLPPKSFTKGKQSLLYSNRYSTMNESKFMNISSSTTIEPLQPQPVSFSPMIRQYMNEFQTTFTQKMNQIIESVHDLKAKADKNEVQQRFQTTFSNQSFERRQTIRRSRLSYNEHSEVASETVIYKDVLAQPIEAATVVPPSNQQQINLKNISWSSLREELRNIVRSEVTQLNQKYTEDVVNNVLDESIHETGIVKCLEICNKSLEWRKSFNYDISSVNYDSIYESINGEQFIDNEPTENKASNDEQMSEPNANLHSNKSQIIDNDSDENCYNDERIPENDEHLIPSNISNKSQAMAKDSEESDRNNDEQIPEPNANLRSSNRSNKSQTMEKDSEGSDRNIDEPIPKHNLRHRSNTSNIINISDDSINVSTFKRPHALLKREKLLPRRASNRLSTRLATASNKKSPVKSDNSKKVTKTTKKKTTAKSDKKEENGAIKKLFAKTSDNLINATSKEQAKEITKSFVLKIINTGNIKEMQMLPQIGMKSAFSIITYRSIHGKFKSIEAVSKLPIWRGKGWERFQNANNL